MEKYDPNGGVIVPRGPQTVLTRGEFVAARYNEAKQKDPNTPKPSVAELNDKSPMPHAVMSGMSVDQIMTHSNTQMVKDYIRDYPEEWARKNGRTYIPRPAARTTPKPTATPSGLHPFTALTYSQIMQHGDRSLIQSYLANHRDEFNRKKAEGK